MNSILSLSRLTQLITNELRCNRKIIIITGIIILLAWTFTVLHRIPGMDQYFFMLYLGGFIITSRSFNTLHETELAYHYLTLPCSNAERFLSEWLLSAVIYPIALLALYTVFFGVYYWISDFNIARPTYYLHWQDFAKYIILHSMIFTGAVFFKRYALMKTLLVLFLPMIVVSALSGAILAHSFPFWIPATLQHFDQLSLAGYILFWFILAPFCWVVTYLRITESEIS